jgi:hypothetical protein
MMMQQTRHLAAILLAVFALASAGLDPVRAQTSPAQPGTSGTAEMPIEDYLALLARIAPAAHDGARAYRQAWLQRCGRPLTAAELRMAMAVGDGNPVLMGMIRASHLRDPVALASLASQIDCARGAR